MATMSSCSTWVGLRLGSGLGGGGDDGGIAEASDTVGSCVVADEVIEAPTDLRSDVGGLIGEVEKAVEAVEDGGAVGERPAQVESACGGTAESVWVSRRFVVCGFGADGGWLLDCLAVPAGRIRRPRRRLRRRPRVGLLAPRR